MTYNLAPQVRILREDEKLVLPERIACATGFTGLDPWLSFIHKTYNFPIYRIVSEVQDEIDGWLALVRVKHLIFGDYLTTSPFGIIRSPGRGSVVGNASSGTLWSRSRGT